MVPQCYLLWTNLICPSDDMNAFAEDLHKIWLWTKTWDVRLNVNKCLHLQKGLGAPQKRIMSYSDGITLDPSYFQSASDLDVIADF